MTERKADEVKAPDPAVVEKAQAKMAEGDDLNQREQKALEAQRALDEERGYEVVEWKGIPLYRALVGGHACFSESEMMQHVTAQRLEAAAAAR